MGQRKRKGRVLARGGPRAEVEVISCGGAEAMPVCPLQGDAHALNNLGLMYYESRGIPQDNIEAYKWIRLAVAHGVKDFRPNLALVSNNMRFWNVWKAKRLAREWLKKPRETQ